MKSEVIQLLSLLQAIEKTAKQGFDCPSVECEGYAPLNQILSLINERAAQLMQKYHVEEGIYEE